MEKVNFFQLSRVVQERFIDASLRRTVPKPFLEQQSMRELPWKWAALGLACLAAFVGLLVWGYGNLDSSVALAPWPLQLAYCLTFAGAALAVFQVVARVSEVQRWPFSPGKYLFPVGVIDASRPAFQIWPLTELEAVEAKGKRVVLRFRDGHVARFKARDDAEAENVRERVVTAKRELMEASIQGDDQELARQNPLREARFSNPLAPLAPHAAPVPRWSKWSPVFAVVLGVGVGMLVGYVRNVLGERALFAAAQRLATPEAYAAYIEHSGKRDEVARFLLPRAELERIKERGTIEELERYAIEHPDSEIRAEVEGEVRRALLDALTKAKALGTLSALDTFSKAHPLHTLVDAEVKTARKVLLEGALRRFLDEHAAPHEEIEPFFQKLLDHAAQHGPTVQVRFHRVVPDSVPRADAIVRKDKAFGAEMLPSQYFDAAHSSAREDAIFAHLDQRFSKAFAPDALKLERGEPIASEQQLPENPPVPSLFIVHSTNMGHGIANSKPPGTFVGVGFLFKAFFVIPNQQEMLQTKYSTWRPPELQKLRKGNLSIPEVYTTMADSAFEQFDKRVVAWLFRRQP